MSTPGPNENTALATLKRRELFQSKPEALQLAAAKRRLANTQETPEQRFDRIQRENNERMEKSERDNKAKLNACADQKGPKSGLTLAQLMLLHERHVP